MTDDHCTNAPQRRRFRRLPVASGAIALELGSTHTLPVVDFSPEGVSVAMAGGTWSVGASEPITLRTPFAHITGRAAAVRQGPRANVVGLRLELDGASERALAETYHRARFPALSRRGQIAPATVHALFERSGYLGLKKDVAPSDEWLAAAWPETLTREAVYTAADGTVLGHLGVTRAYRRTWLGHEIATLRDHPEALACRRSLYHHFANWPRLLDGDQAMLLGYYNRSRPWHRALFEAFAAGSDPGRECLVMPLDRFLLSPESDPGTAPPGVSVSPLDAGEAERVRALIAAAWPRLAVQAFDLDGEGLESACLHPEYARAGLQRARSVLALRDHGVLVGAALCETSSGQLSLFNVLNGAQLFFAGGVPAPAQAALVRAVREFFAARGVKSPLLVANPGQLHEDAAAGLRLIETMGAIVWTARGLARYEDYIDQTLADYPLGAPQPAVAHGHHPQPPRRN
jgi:hypothetical protein